MELEHDDKQAFIGAHLVIYSERASDLSIDGCETRSSSDETSAAFLDRCP